MDRFFPGERRRSARVITSEADKQAKVARPTTTVVLSSAISDIFSAVVEENAHGVIIPRDTNPRVINVAALLVTPGAINKPGSRKNVTFAGGLEGLESSTSQKSRFDSIINKYMIHSVAHPSVSGAIRPKSLTRENAGPEIAASQSIADGTFVTFSQSSFIEPQTVEEEDSDSETEESSIDLEEMDGPETLRGGVDQYDLGDDFIDDSELIAEIEMVGEAAAPNTTDETSPKVQRSAGIVWEHYKILTANEMNKLLSHQMTPAKVPLSGYLLQEDVAQLKMPVVAPVATNKAADSEDDGSVVGGVPQSSRTPRKNESTDGKGGEKKATRRAEEDEQKKREFIEEHLEKPWNFTPEIQTALSIYAKAVKSRNNRLKEATKAVSGGEASISATQMNEPLPEEYVHTKTLDMERFGRLARLLPNGLRDVRPEGTPYDVVMDVYGFPYELDDMFAALDLRVREANKGNRPAPYVAHLMKIRGFPASREGVRLHFMRAAALYDAAQKRDKLLQRIASFHSLLRSEVDANPDMMEDTATILEDEQQRFSILQRYDLMALQKSGTRLNVAADCFRKSEEDDAKQAAKPDADPAVKLRVTFTSDYDDFAAATLKEDAEAADQTPAPTTTIIDAVLGRGSTLRDVNDIINVHGWFHWTDEARQALFLVVEEAYSWICAENVYRSQVKFKQVKDMHLGSAPFALLNPLNALQQLVFPEILQDTPAGAISAESLRVQLKLQAVKQVENGFATDPAAAAYSAYLKLKTSGIESVEAVDEEDNADSTKDDKGAEEALPGTPATAGMKSPTVAGVKRKRPSTAKKSAAAGAGAVDGPADMFDKPLKFRFDRFWSKEVIETQKQLSQGSVLSPTQKNAAHTPLG